MRASVKQKALSAIEQLPHDAGFEEIMERLYFLTKVEQGLEQIERGEVVSHAEAKRRLGR